MKDRHGNEWVFLPAKLLPQMAEAIHYGPNSADDAPTLNDVQFWGECWDAAIAAAPKFEAVEVDDAVCERIYMRYLETQEPGCKPVRQIARVWLQVWQTELGPALGLVSREEMAGLVEAAYREALGKVSCSDAYTDWSWGESNARKQLESK